MGQAGPTLRSDFVIIGGGSAGEAAAGLARRRGASVTVVERDLLGGSCPFWACMPSKALLHAAEVRAAGGDYSWASASARRDYMIVREDREYPDDSGHLRSLEQAGATVLRGTARLVGPGEVAVTHDGEDHRLQARDVVIAIGSVGKVPPIPGLEQAGYWSNREATTTRELPRSIVVLGAGPSGVEIAQYYARFGVPTTLVASRRVNPADHPRSSALLAEALRASGVDLRLGVRAQRVQAGAGAGGAHVIELADGSSLEAHVIQLSVGRTAAPALRELGLETVGVVYDGTADSVSVGEDLLLGPGIYAAGDVIGRERSTHLAHYTGEIAVRIAMGDDVRADLGSIPRVVYTDPPLAAVGLTLDQARERGIDAFELTEDLATSAPGYLGEFGGHVTITVDRSSATLAGAFIGGPGAGEAIHEAVLALKLRTPLATLANTVHAFPTVARVMGGLFDRAARESG